MPYSTKIRFKGGLKRSLKSSRLSSSKNFSSNGKSWKHRWEKFKLSKKKSHRFRKFFARIFGFLVLIALIGMIFVLSYVQKISEDLPSKDQPFGKNKGNASYIYDRNGKVLYKMFDTENHDPVAIAEVPDLLKWSFMAAEDINFYNHPGVDARAIARCAVKNIIERGVACGGSTLTQQVVKQTSLTNEIKYERKIKEILLSLQIEKEHSKDEILEIYLTISPEGSNIYGVKTAAQFYFGKQLSELNLAEMAILASIPQNPTQLSPTKSANPEVSQVSVKKRQEYVLDQLEKNLVFINKTNKEQNHTDKDILTKEMIAEARKFELVYREPRFEIKAPHFVFYVQQQLMNQNYNNGVPFTLSELETGGYKIYTTLDLDYQALAEQQVKVGVEKYGRKYGGENAALVAMNPKTGEILAMAGSYDYFGTAVPENCTPGKDCKFEPHVNITNSLQSPGSSMKPMVYYMGMMNGLISPGTLMPDIPIQIGSYKPKNFEGGFNGIQTARFQLSKSRNIPAITLVNQIGITNFITEMQKWGYTTLNSAAGYGPSIAVGGSDIKLVDHAEAYTIFANEGKHTAKETILKIENEAGKNIFEHNPVSEQVADPRGVYLINHILNGKNGGPGDSWDGRDVAGKTGTSEEQREVLFATYTPEMIVVGWLGNNDNTSLKDGVSGFVTAKPWIAEYLKLIGGSFPATAFPRPGGIESGSTCSVAEALLGNADATALCADFKSDLVISGLKTPATVEVNTALVCTDEPQKLARDIDINLGLTQSITTKYYKMLDPNLQKFLDEWMQGIAEYGKNGPPTEFCTINRNPSGQNKPWAVIVKPTAATALGQKLDVEVSAFSPNGKVTKIQIYLDNKMILESDKIPYIDSIDLTSLNLQSGSHLFTIKTLDATGAEGSTSISLEKLGTLSFTLPATLTAGSTITVNFTYSGSKIDKVILHNSLGLDTTCGVSSCSWKIPAKTGAVDVYLSGSVQGVLVQSGKTPGTITN
ncbi:MAG: transglycosylase domain-containing protein [bacterium]